MSRVAMIDGLLSPLAEAKISVTDRGFLYGDSVFETVRTYDGRPFALGRHLDRLERSAGLVHIPLPVSKGELAREVNEAVRAAGNPESYVRITVTRGQGEFGLDPALADRPRRVVIVTPLSPPPERAYERGISAVTFATRRVADATVAEGAKLGNYLVSVLAVRAARAKGGDEALIVDGAGRVVEGATSNVFFVSGRRLVTPAEDAGILPGITRELVLASARALGFELVFDSPRAGELGTFEEAFVSSSVREMLALVKIDDMVVGAGAPGAAYRALLAELRRQIRAVHAAAG